MPLGSFALILGSLGSDALHSCVANHIGIHFTEGFRITSETRFKDVDLQFTAGSHLLIYYILNFKLINKGFWGFGGPFLFSTSRLCLCMICLLQDIWLCDII